MKRNLPKSWGIILRRISLGDQSSWRAVIFVDRVETCKKRVLATHMVNDQRSTNLVQNVTRFWLVEIHVIPALWWRFVYPLASISLSLSLSRKKRTTCKSVIWFVYLTQFRSMVPLCLSAHWERGKLLFFPANSPNFLQLSDQAKFSLLTNKQLNWICRQTGA